MLALEKCLKVFGHFLLGYPGFGFGCCNCVLTFCMYFEYYPLFRYKLCKCLPAPTMLILSSTGLLVMLFTFAYNWTCCWEFSSIWLGLYFWTMPEPVVTWGTGTWVREVYTCEYSINPAKVSAGTNLGGEGTPSTSLNSRSALTSVVGCGQMWLLLIN